MTDSHIAVLLGILVIVSALIPGKYRPAFKRGDTQTMVPAWFGTLWFVVIGLVLIYIGLYPSK